MDLTMYPAVLPPAVQVLATTPDHAVMDYYHKLKERVILEFGADNVSDRHSFLTP